jgi:hypothetical protein
MEVPVSSLLAGSATVIEVSDGVSEFFETGVGLVF